jgi:hypothetical protein
MALEAWGGYSWISSPDEYGTGWNNPSTAEPAEEVGVMGWFDIPVPFELRFGGGIDARRLVVSGTGPRHSVLQYGLSLAPHIGYTLFDRVGIFFEPTTKIYAPSPAFENLMVSYRGGVSVPLSREFVLECSLRSAGTFMIENSPPSTLAANLSLVWFPPLF